LEIVGTDGRLILEAPFRADKAGGAIEILRGDESETETFEAGDPYLAELEEFAAAIREERDPAVGTEEILGNARAIGGLLNSARQGGRVQSL
jgi:predicted dehydrogenase